MNIFKVILSKVSIVSLAIVLGAGGLISVQASLDDILSEDNLETYYLDADRDGYGNSDISTTTVERPDGYAVLGGDCNEINAMVNPGASEVCDGIDNNCNGEIDEDTKISYYQDLDGDTYGNISVATSSCSAPSGFTDDNTDCDDTASTTYPSAAEIEDRIDNNCNGRIDEDFIKTYYLDNDGDEYGQTAVSTTSLEKPVGFAILNGDCNDAYPAINPGMTEICNGIDDNCNGLVDENLLTVFYFDGDNDDYGLTGSSTSACVLPSGYAEIGGDCNDNDGNVYPENNEIYDGKDNDCDGYTDENLLNNYYLDNDGDGYGQTDVSTTSLEQPDGYAENFGDCNDSNDEIYPGAEEICDGYDNDCDGDINENCQNSDYYCGDKLQYRNHGEYMKHMAQCTNNLKSQGEITGKEKGQAMKGAASSNGQKKQNQNKGSNGKNGKGKN